MPFAFLFGILRSRLARGSVAGLMVSLEHGRPLRDAIADALGDPSLGLAFWLEERAAAGSTATAGRSTCRSCRIGRSPSSSATAGGSARSSTTSRSRGEPELVESVAAAVAFALDNERLQAELRAQNEFLLTIVDTAPSLLVTVDTDGRIRRLNPATVEASGYATAARSRGRTSGTSSSTRPSARR